MLRPGGHPTTCAPSPPRGKFRAVQKRSTNLLFISLAVGAFGALTGRLLTWLAAPGFDFGLTPFAFAWLSPLVLFATASATFAIAFGGMVPDIEVIARQMRSSSKGEREYLRRQLPMGHHRTPPPYSQGSGYLLSLQ